MKILQIINSLETGGAEKLILESMPLFNKKGIQVDLAVLKKTKTPFMDILEKLNCCTIYSLGNNLYAPSVVFKIRSLLKKYDLIHVHIFPSLYWVALTKMLSFSKIKLVYTEHSTSNNRRKSFVFRIIDRFIYSLYSKIITISFEVDENIKKHLNCNSDKFELIQNGINLNTIKEAESYTKSNLIPEKENAVFLIQVSSFRYPKDQKTVIKSLKHLEDNVILLLVGDGPLKNDCEDLVKDLNLTDKVFFLGIRMDVINLLKSSDIVILSSYHEGLSLSSIEGMASGKPFIATDSPGLGDIVKGAGILFPINDDKALAKEIKTLLSDKNHYNSTVNNCVARANNYSIDKTVEKEINLYKSLLQK